MRVRLPYWYIIAVPILLIFAGALSNQVVLIVNHDKFPVMVNARKLARLMKPPASEWDQRVQNAHQYEVIDGLVRIPLSIVSYQTALNSDPDGMLDDIHCVMSPTSHLKALADIWDMKDAIYSIGDFGIIFGSWLWNFAPLAWLALAVRKLIAEA